MGDRFTERAGDKRVKHDLRVLGDFIHLYCDAHHAGRVRRAATSEGAALSVYGRRKPMLCIECDAHLDYAEKRRVYCPKDPKPFCAHCDTHCYRPDEAEWQREMMRFSGPRSWRRGHALDGLRHMMEGRRVERALRARAEVEPEGSAAD